MLFRGVVRGRVCRREWTYKGARVDKLLVCIILGFRGERERERVRRREEEKKRRREEEKKRRGEERRERERERER